MTNNSDLKNTTSCYVWMRLKEYLHYRGLSESIYLKAEEEGACFIADELRYSVNAIDEVLTNASDQLNDDLVGLKSGMHFQSLKFGLYHALLGQIENVEKSVELAIRYLPLETQGIRLAVKPQQNHCELIIIPVAEGLSRLQLENLISQIYCRLIKTEPSWTKIQFGYAVKNPEKYKKLLGCETEFNKEYTAILFDNKVMCRDLGWRDQLIFTTLERLAKKRLARLYSYTSVIDEVKFLTRQQVLSRSVGLGGAARFLGVSERRLQKMLYEEGSNYREIVGQVKGELALELLNHTRMSAPQIAEQLGFEELSSFYRFFKRATGINVSRSKMTKSLPAELDPAELV